MKQDSEDALRRRVDELEIKAAFQEQLIGDLNEELIRHGERLTDLEGKQLRLIEHLKSLTQQDSPADEPPPHY